MTPRSYHLSVAVMFAVCALGASAAEVIARNVIANDGPGLSLRIADEAAPAGSIVQIKVEVTEPKPISTGRGKIKATGVSTVVGIVLMNRDQDTYGVAVVDGGELSFNITSPTNLFGTAADYPILGIAGTVRNASLGTSFPMTIDPSAIGFVDPAGAAYPTEIANGTLTVANGVAISDVSPGSAVVPAGGTVRISGTNFTPNTRIRLGEVAIAEQRFINSQRIDVVLAQTANMHGLRIRARNDERNDRSESEYFSYERTTQIGRSNDAILSKAVPLFAPMTYTAATVELPKRATSGRRRAVRPAFEPAAAPAKTLGFALQNLQGSTATASVELLDKAGNPYAVNTLTVDPDHYLVRELSEIFGTVSPPAAFRIRSNVPIQILGLTAETSTGIATALPPH